MWSLDGTAIKVGGPILTPDLNAVDGTLSPSPGHEVRARGERGQAPGSDRRPQEERRSLPDRRKAAQAAGGARRAPDGRLDGRHERRSGRASVVHAVRRLRGRAGPRLRPADANRLVPEAGPPSDRQGDRAHRPGGHRPRQAAADRARHGDTALRRSRLQGERRHPHASERPVANGDHGRADVRSEGDRSVEQRGPPSSAP